MHTDPIADMLTRIRNAQQAKKTEVVLPFSNLKFNIAKILATHNYLGAVEKIELEKDKKTTFQAIKIALRYENKQPQITHIKRVSKPGRRVYVAKDHIPTVLNNYGLAIISTPRGLLTNFEAKKAGVGGEVICEVY